MDEVVVVVVDVVVGSTTAPGKVVVVADVVVVVVDVVDVVVVVIVGRGAVFSPTYSAKYMGAAAARITVNAPAKTVFSPTFIQKTTQGYF